MIGLEVNDVAVVREQQKLERLMTTNPKTEKALRELLRQVILQARADVMRSVTFENGDPRQSRRAIRTTVYKKILGANINIYNSRRSHGVQRYMPPHTLRPGQRGGNRVKPSQRTLQLQSYAPEDRGFILRFVNSGTIDRVIPFSPHDDRKPSKWNKHPNTGNRGHIEGINFFRNLGEQAMTRAADNLATLIDTEIDNILNGKQ